MRLTVKQMEVFHAIVVAGSISHAKRVLGLSQPTISQQLAKMEELLGVQLIHRGRGESLRLTAAGEYWYKASHRILTEFENAEQQHRILFDEKRLTLHFGTTPSLRGRFTEVAAQTALELDQFARFDFDWGLTSAEVVENINAHKFNCGVVSAASIEDQRASFHIEPLFKDRIVLAVPASIPEEVLALALDRLDVAPGAEALNRYVDVTPPIPWRERSDNWYRASLPFASPYFGCVTHQAAVDVVAAGLATCHTPISLLPNLPEQVLNRIKVYDIGEHVREVVFVMPKHLMSLKPFATFASKISEYVRQTYNDTQVRERIRPLPQLQDFVVAAAE
ncbi:LysR family transcriptional regulator [Maritimibacter sp. DP1N21-5]|uniref:LysR family transcriptional regulator n=1 Tax=Maritimibacter sp. DP1N21-5 TaxID=2836867 RepID=UPI001C479AAF|nr:LysR family transcriptional regulator [Maritimibacter sp. DP1N21-5]MBV7407730.1 LysR family transcriptional regulator [Maritimibacter sp. DP1N21-5]